MALGLPAPSPLVRPSAALLSADRGSAFRLPSIVNPNAAAPASTIHFRLELAREHNDANVLALGARLIGSDMAKACVAAFLDTGFAGGRHQRRIDQLSQILQESD